MKPKNHIFLQALQREPVPYTPIWIMRQAGRYLPEYRATRAKAGSFMQLCKTPELACEVTLQPLNRFDLDAAILFSDILTIPDAMGAGLSFIEGEGPVFKNPVKTPEAIAQLQTQDLEEKLDYVANAVKLIQHELDHRLPLIGFSGSPWTLATYLIEGKSSRDHHAIKKWMYQDPKSLHHLLRVLSDAVIRYLTMQIHAGVNAVMIFDTWGGILSTPAFHEFSLAYIRDILKALPTSTPTIVFTKNSGLWLSSIADTGCSAVGIDWMVDINSAFSQIGNKVAIQGNLDPAILLSNPKSIECEAIALLNQVHNRPGHIFNLGHGITPDVPPEHVEILVNTVHAHSKR